MSESFMKVRDVYENDENLNEEDVNELREWINSQEHLPEIQELQLLLFLHSCYYNMDATKKCIDAYYTMRTSVPIFFSDRNVLSEEMQVQLQVSLITPLPKMTSDNHLVFYIRLIDPDAQNYIYNAQVKMLDMSIQLALLQKGPKPGFVVIFDMLDTTFAHLFRINPLTSKKFVDYVQEALPVRLKAVHLVNVNAFTAQFINLIKPFMKRHLTELLHVHRTLDSLHGMVPKEILPNEAGGQAGTIDELHDAQITNLENHVNFFLEDEKLKSDENKRTVRRNSSSLFKGLFT